MKKLALLAMAITIASCMDVGAEVVAGHFTGVQLNMTYPLVYTKNAIGQKEINTDLANIIYDMKGKYDSGKYYSAKMDYEVTCENDDIISLGLKTYVVQYPGAVHSFSAYTGLVYNKNTGERIPLNEYVTIKSAKQIQGALMDGVISSHNWDMQRNCFFREDMFKVKKVSSNYVLGSDGSVYLIYQPYSIGPFAFGPYKVRFSPTAIDYFNRMNRHSF